MENNQKNTANDNKSKGLPPNFRYPSSDLETCLLHSRKIFSKSGCHYLESSAIYADIEMSEKSGHASRLIASMKYYGILEAHPKNKTFKLSEHAVTYASENKLTSEEVSFFINNPVINQKIFITYPLNTQPSLNGIKGYLIKNCGYNEKQADEFLSVHSKNIELYKKFFTTEPIREAEAIIVDRAVTLPTLKNSELESTQENMNLKFPLPSENQSLSVSFPKNPSEKDIAVMIKTLEFVIDTYIKR